MKKVISVLLALLMIGLIVLPAGAKTNEVNNYLEGETSLAKLGTLKISTGGKAKQLTLKWSIIPRAGGYEVYRSATGKTGSYKLLEEVYDSSYTDTGLKDSTVYYYAVRAFAWNGEKTIYSPWAKANLSTRITKAFAVKRFKAAYKAMSAIYYYVDFDDSLRANADGGYYWLNLKNVNSKATFKKYLQKYFTKSLAKRLMPKSIEKNGKLYIWMPSGLGGADFLLLNKTAADQMKYADRSVRFRLSVTYGSYGEEEPAVQRMAQGLSFESGRWVINETNADFWVYNAIFDYV